MQYAIQFAPPIVLHTYSAERPAARAQSLSNTSLSHFGSTVVLYSTVRSDRKGLASSVVLYALVLMHATSIIERSCLIFSFFSWCCISQMVFLFLLVYQSDDCAAEFHSWVWVCQRPVRRNVLWGPWC